MCVVTSRSRLQQHTVNLGKRREDRPKDGNASERGPLPDLSILLGTLLENEGAAGGAGVGFGLVLAALNGAAAAGIGVLLQAGMLSPGCFAVGVPLSLEGRAVFCGAACGAVCGDAAAAAVFSGRSGFEFFTPDGLAMAGFVMGSSVLLASMSKVSPSASGTLPRSPR